MEPAMIPRFRATFAGLLFAAVPAFSAAPAPAGDPAAFKPTLAVRVAPLDTLLADIRFTAERIAKFAPSDEEAKRFVSATDGMLDRALGPDWRKGVDTKRPLLGYFLLDSDPSASLGVALIPVNDEAAFRKTLTDLVGRVDDEKDGVLRFEVGGARCCIRFANKYAYLTYRDPAVISLNRIPAPEQVIAGDPSVAASARLHLDRVPDSMRQQAVNGVQQSRAMFGGGNAGGNTAFVPAVSLIQMVLFGGPLLQLYPLAEPIVRDSKEVTLDLRYDRARLNLTTELTVTTNPDSELAKQVAAIKPLSSLFPQMFGPEVAAHGLIRGSIPKEVRDWFVPMMETGVKAMPTNSPVWGVFAGKLAESLLPTLREGEIDLALGLRGPYEDTYGLFAALRLRDAPSVEKAFRAVIKDLPKDAQDMFRLDAGSIGETKFHAIKLPPLPEPAKSLFGDDSILIVFRPDAVVVGFGKSSMVSLQEGLAAKPQPAPRSFVEASGRKLVPLVTKIDAEAGKKFKAFLGDQIDRVPILDVAVEGGQSLKIRYGNGLMTVMPLMLFARAVGPSQPAAIVVPAPPAP
jgi:hypothetical protein